MHIRDLGWSRGRAKPQAVFAASGLAISRTTYCENWLPLILRPQPVPQEDTHE